MAKIWMRLGCGVELTADELKEAFEMGRLETVLKKAIEEGRVRPDGESYVPEGVISCLNDELGTHFEECDYECVL